MMQWRSHGWLLSLGALAVLFACQESLTTPGDCPGTCPGGNSQVFDTVLNALTGRDSSFRGYVGQSEGPAMLVSNGLPAGEARTFYAFLARGDSAFIAGNLQPYAIDSVWLDLNVVGRDSLSTGLKLYIHRIPIEVDTLFGFSAFDALLTPGTIIDSIDVPDTLRTGPVRAVLTGDLLDKFAIPEADTGHIAIGVRMAADGPSGVRLSSLSSSLAPPTYTTFVHTLTEAADTARLVTGTDRVGFFIDRVSTDDPDLLTLGGFPSARVLIRFKVPARLLDSVNVVRATLELTPDSPVRGLPNDIASLSVLPILSDLGAKSIIPSNVFASGATVRDGDVNPYEIDVIGLVAGWRGTGGPPHALFISMQPESGTFYQPAFRSTRSASGGPTLRLTYVIPSQPERP